LQKKKKIMKWSEFCATIALTIFMDQLNLLKDRVRKWQQMISLSIDGILTDIGIFSP